MALVLIDFDCNSRDYVFKPIGYPYFVIINRRCNLSAIKKYKLNPIDKPFKSIQ
jgi:hypothetical protein